MPSMNLLLESADGADMAEGRHGAAQAIGFVGREFGGDDGQPHRLFLEQGNAQGLFQHLLQFVLADVRDPGWDNRTLCSDCRAAACGA